MCPEFDKRYTSKRWATFNYNSSKTSGLGMTGAKSKEKKENKLLFKLFCCQICTQEGIHFSYRKNTENCILANPSRSAHMTGTCITFFFVYVIFAIALDSRYIYVFQRKISLSVASLKTGYSV